MNRRCFNALFVQAAMMATAPRLVAQGRALPRLSCMLWTLTGPHRTLDQAVDLVAAAGYQGVELVGEFHRWPTEETRRVLARLRSLNLVVDSVSGVAAGFAVPADTDAFMAQFTRHLAAAQDLGCSQVILLSGARVPGLSPEAQQEVAITNLTRAADLAAQAKVEIVIEPIDALEQPTIYLQSVTEAFAIVRRVNRPNLKVLYDLYHEQRGSGNLLEKLTGNLDLIGLFHVADVPGRHEPGTGEIAYDHVFATLARLHYTRWIAMEYYPTGDPVASLCSSRQAVLQAYAGVGGAARLGDQAPGSPA